MPHLFELAPTGRAKCRGCGQAIPARTWRFGERLPNPFADGEGVEMTHWFHPACAAFKRPEPFLDTLETAPPDLADRDLLEHEARLGLAPSPAASRGCREPCTVRTRGLPRLQDAD